MILVSHQLPVVSRIIKASSADPYIAVILPLDREKLRRYYEPTKSPKADDASAAMVCHVIDPSILEALGRLLALHEETEIAPLVAPLIEDEIHARLLFSPMGAMLARLMWYDDRSTQIARVIKLMSDDLSNSLSIPELADRVGMSKSALHLHFKAVTGMSPLAYTKELRLLKAQTYVRESDRPISMIGYDVGYESPAQFSREYARKFYLSPRQDRSAAR
jgi:AraC-like DNA-binding protein